VRLLRSLALLALGLAVPAVAPAAEERVIVAFGDSLTAGFGVDPELAWPAFLQERLVREGYLSTSEGQPFHDPTGGGGIGPAGRPIKFELTEKTIDFLGYSRFVVRSLHEHVSTEHCLIIQADGFVLNPDRWSPEFAQYDYVGAPWPEFVFLQPGNRRFYLNRNRVGNGGFSLRSKRLLEITSRIDFDQLKFPVLSEDLVICHYLYDDMRSAGVRFAPTDVAARFSIESPHGTAGQPLDSTFGFHGKHWFGELVDRLISERTTLQT